MNEHIESTWEKLIGAAENRDLAAVRHFVKRLDALFELVELERAVQQQIAVIADQQLFGAAGTVRAARSL